MRMWSRWHRAWARTICLVAIGLSGCGSTAPITQPVADAHDGTLISISFDPSQPDSPQLQARVCAPPGAVPGRVRYPLAVINHGSTGVGENSSTLQPAACDSPPMHWFTSHGYVALALMRRGFGSSSGQVAENVGACVAPDYAASAEAGAEDIAAGLRAGLALDMVEPRDAVVVGQSTGGWATLAYVGQPDPRVQGAVVFSPGRGAHAYAPPDSVCRPDLLIQAAGQLGLRARLPVLWIAAENDSFFPPDITSRLKEAYVQGGATARLVMLPSFEAEGHALFSAPGGADIWGEYVGKFLSRLPPT